MCLSHMLAVDKDALICDMAETYRIYDLNAVPVRILATLAAGLGCDSRVIAKENGLKAPFSVVLTAGILDRLNLLIWMRTEDGVSGRNRPESVASTFMDTDVEVEKDGSSPVIFSSTEDFKAAYDRVHNAERK